MKALNRVMLIGNLGKDPEVGTVGSGTSVCKFSLATSESWKGSDGEKQERTEWHNIIAWRKLAEICGQYLKKGDKVYIEGKLYTSSWEDKTSGVKKWKTEVVAENMIMLGGHPDKEETAPQGEAPAEDPHKDLPF